MIYVGLQSPGSTLDDNLDLHILIFRFAKVASMLLFLKNPHSKAVYSSLFFKLESIKKCLLKSLI
jgi:hypothetical protein